MRRGPPAAAAATAAALGESRAARALMPAGTATRPSPLVQKCTGMVGTGASCHTDPPLAAALAAHLSQACCAGPRAAWRRGPAAACPPPPGPGSASVRRRQPARRPWHPRRAQAWACRRRSLLPRLARQRQHPAPALLSRTWTARLQGKTAPSTSHSGKLSNRACHTYTYSSGSAVLASAQQPLARSPLRLLADLGLLLPPPEGRAPAGSCCPD